MSWQNLDNLAQFLASFFPARNLSNGFKTTLSMRGLKMFGFVFGNLNGIKTC